MPRLLIAFVSLFAVGSICQAELITLTFDLTSLTTARGSDVKFVSQLFVDGNSEATFNLKPQGGPSGFNAELVSSNGGTGFGAFTDTLGESDEIEDAKREYLNFVAPEMLNMGSNTIAFSGFTELTLNDYAGTDAFSLDLIDGTGAITGAIPMSNYSLSDQVIKFNSPQLAFRITSDTGEFYTKQISASYAFTNVVAVPEISSLAYLVPTLLGGLCLRRCRRNASAIDLM
ncbi:hypothetical protein Poly59_10280 [Rubripirellula reticaptiva]|uniref:PEP-CTERM protein-sorting domain-containing protein n=2 Tax=Rubripirellula reticaptiva TaxID=2528013 RepID=A0A5C6FER1_9BACT|nr:hypothetical protein Poly59_10280 [Rubripirellula reticaptiva]